MKSEKDSKSTTFGPKILAPEESSRPGRQRCHGKSRTPATHRETDLARSEDRREDQAANLNGRSAHVAINSEVPP
jgi:hypothetical protein